MKGSAEHLILDDEGHDDSADSSGDESCDGKDSDTSEMSVESIDGEPLLDGPWTEIRPEDVGVQRSYVSDSMYLVLEDPSSRMMHGEKIVAKEHALGTRSPCGSLQTTAPGTLFITNYRLLFVAFGSGNCSPPFVSQDNCGCDAVFSVEIPLCSIASFKAGRSNEVISVTSVLDVSTKNFQIHRFGFPFEFSTSDVYYGLQKLLSGQAMQFAFICTPPRLLPDRQSWDIYDPVLEYQRQGLCPLDNSSIWRMTAANNDYSLCDTYPKMLIVPASVTDDDLFKVARYRAKSRIPVVTYFHRASGATISRCSQPLVGLRRARCMEDEELIAAIWSNNPSSSPLAFIDCRNQTSAFANLAIGAGFESTANYERSEMLFMGIENIHCMRESARKLFELVQSTLRGQEDGHHWLSQLESTKWLEHVRSLLRAAGRCVELVAVRRASIVCHCSDGWDRTSQLVSLVKLLLDPFYRTFAGFQILIEQEWCSFGHRFADRCGYGDRAINFWEDENCSPVFVQFLDAVWQLIQQFPCSFEFNGKYLKALTELVYSGRIGTFFGNCEKDRVEAAVSTKCLSVWTVLGSQGRNKEYHNPYYSLPGNPSAHGGTIPKVLRPDCHPANVSMWTENYFPVRSSGSGKNGRESRAVELRRRCNALAGAKATLSMQLKRTREQLALETSEKKQLAAELRGLKSERKRLRLLLEGHVFSDGQVVVREEEDGDSVVLSVNSADQGEQWLCSSQEELSDSASSVEGCDLTHRNLTRMAEGCSKMVASNATISSDAPAGRVNRASRPIIYRSIPADVGFQLLRSYFSVEDDDDADFDLD